VSKGKVLVIEDEEDISELLAIRLTRMGHYVAVAGDGELGLQKARETRPDLIILDLMLPRLTGEEVCKAIREDEDKKISDIPIIMLTAKVTQVDKIIGKVIGANSYMTKPFDPDDLMAEIERFLKTNQNTKVS
jgi:DNA-binding response OmpR family regulator